MPVLVILYVFNFLDRQIVNILAEPIKRDLALADCEVGFTYRTGAGATTPEDDLSLAYERPKT